MKTMFTLMGVIALTALLSGCGTTPTSAAGATTSGTQQAASQWCVDGKHVPYSADCAPGAVAAGTAKLQSRFR